VDDKTCLFCEELETVNHLLFEYCVAMLTWMNISEITGVAAGQDFESVARLWLHNKNLKCVNVCNAVVIWSI
jgi:uncharacterized protein YggL (DUF469 family)